MQRIWAPWRMRYILGKKSDACIFCIKKKGGYKRRHHILAQSRHAFVMLNRYPYSAAHLMVVPYRHVPDLDGLAPEELWDFFQLVQASCRTLKAAVRPDGLNIGANLGKAAGAGAADHFHFHLVARWQGDHNFMPVLSDTMIISESLDDTYNRLLPYFREIAQPE